MHSLASLALLLALSGLSAPAALAQQPDSSISLAHPPTLRPVPINGPLYVLNEQYIIGDNGLRAIAPDNIGRLEVYKDGSAPAKWRSLAYHGILAIALKTKVRLDSKSLPQLQRWLKLAGPVRFQVEGLFVEDETLRVATDAIAALEIKRPTEPTGETIVNIRLVRLPPPPVPPGQIRIRGLAQQSE